MSIIETIAVFGKALRNYRDGYESADRKAQALVLAAQELGAIIGRWEADPPDNVVTALDAVDATHRIAGTYHGKSAYDAAVRAAAEEIAKWADPPRDEKRSDTDVSDLIADHGRAAE